MLGNLVSPLKKIVSIGNDVRFHTGLFAVGGMRIAIEGP